MKTDSNCQCCFSVTANCLKGVSIWTSLSITMLYTSPPLFENEATARSKVIKWLETLYKRR